MLIARTAGFRAIFLHVHFGPTARSFSENHSAVSGGIGMRRTSSATARSKFCWLRNSSESSARAIAARMERSVHRLWLIGAQFKRARCRGSNLLMLCRVEGALRPATLAIGDVPAPGTGKVH